MGSSLLTENLYRNNYASWSYKMHQYLLGHGYWSYVEGANDATLNSTHMEFPTWEQSASRVLYCFASIIDDQLLSYIRDTKTPKEPWGNLKKIFAASTTTRKLQLRLELRNVRQRDMSMADYTSKIKDNCDFIASIIMIVEEEKIV